MRRLLISLAALLVSAGSAQTVAGLGGTYTLIQCAQLPDAIRCDMTFTPKRDGLTRDFRVEQFTDGQDGDTSLIVGATPGQSLTRMAPVPLTLFLLDRQVRRLERLTIEGTTLRFIPICRNGTSTVTVVDDMPALSLSTCLP